jgi:gliding motility-associated-like protein
LKKNFLNKFFHYIFAFFNEIMNNKITITIAVVLQTLTFQFFAQTMFTNGATLFVNAGGILTCNGGLSLTNSSQITNNGDILVTKNATNLSPGTLTISTISNLSGNGTYQIEQDWVNDAFFTAGASTVNLYGNTEQFITSTNNTISEFNNLILSGNGTGNNRKKTLQNVNAKISVSGQLTLNDRECSTQTNDLSVLNPSNGAITNSLIFGNEGFVSSDIPGYLLWATNSTNAYNFPVGSSNGTLRYRAAIIQPSSSASNEYAVRMNNVIADNDGYFLSQHDADVSAANTLFYHSIEQTSGTTKADVTLTYFAATDGDWANMAHWTDNTSMWNDMGTTFLGAQTYSSVQKASWDFSDGYQPFVLTNINEELIIPNVFTPNNDGANDSYFVTAKGITEYTITILNRWGDVVFESTDITKQWDGTTGGNLCAEGTYFYFIKAKSASKDFLKQGHITLNY